MFSSDSEEQILSVQIEVLHIQQTLLMRGLQQNHNVSGKVK
jgi:hypothetical protein